MCRSFESSLEPSLRRVTGPHANLRVAARVYDVEGGAIFAKNSTFVFFDGFAWTPRLRSPSPIMAPAATKKKIECRERLCQNELLGVVLGSYSHLTRSYRLLNSG